MKWRSQVWLVLLLAALAATINAQKKKAAPAPAPAAPIGFPLEQLKVEGNHHYSVEKIIAASGLKIQQRLTRSDFDAARNRLLATGAFHSVAYDFHPSNDYDGYDGIFRVEEIEQIFPVRFEDLPASDDQLREVIERTEPLFGEQIPGTKEVIDRMSKAIEQSLDGKLPVTAKVLADDPKQLAIVFRPSTPRLNLAAVRFTGTEVLPASLLVEKMSDLAFGVPYTEIALRQLLDANIRPLYEARGRVRVKFVKIELSKPGDVGNTTDVDGIAATVTVDEGPSFDLGEVTFKGGDKTAAELRHLANLRTGDVANFDLVNAAVDRIAKDFRHRGYLHFNSHVDRDVHDAGHKVDLRITLDPGSQYAYGKLVIEGLDLLSEPAIRKAWGSKEGKPFDPDAPDAFLKEIREEGIFDHLGKTRSEVKIHDDSKTVDVTLYFAADGKDGGDQGPLNRRRPGNLVGL